MRKRPLATMFSILAGTAIMLAAVLLLEYAAMRVLLVERTWVRAAAVLGAFLAGIVLLVGGIFLSTHLVVRLFRHETVPDSEHFRFPSPKP